MSSAPPTRGRVSEFVRWVVRTPWAVFALGMLQADVIGALLVMGFLRFGLPPGDRSSWFSLAERWMAADGTTSDKLARDEAVRAVQVAVAVLPSDQRAAVALHHLQGQSVEATAAKLCRSPAAVRGLLQRARKSLRELLGRSSRWFERKP